MESLVMNIIIIDENLLVEAISAVAYLDYATDFWRQYILILDFDRYTGLYLSVGMMIAGILSLFGSQIPVDPDNKHKETLEKIKKSLAIVSKPLIIVGGIGFIITLIAVIRADAVADTKDLMRQSIDQSEVMKELKDIKGSVRSGLDISTNTAQFLVKLPEELKNNILNMQVNENGEIIELLRSQSNLYTDIYGNVWNNVDGAYIMVEQHGAIRGVIQNYVATNVHSVNVNPTAPTMTVYHVHSNPVNPQLMNNNFVVVDQNNNLLNNEGQFEPNIITDVINPNEIIPPQGQPVSSIFNSNSNVYNTFVPRPVVNSLLGVNIEDISNISTKPNIIDNVNNEKI